MATLNDIDEELADRIMKILAMAKHKDSNENEAANAMRMAQKLADAHNLSLANLDPESRSSAGKKRAGQKTNGGLYVWQRELYAAIAKLNHCKHWCSEEEETGKVSAYEKRKWGAEEAKYRAENGYASWGKTFRHRLLGSPVNVISTQMMADYLQDAIERMARDYVGNDAKKFFIPDAIAFREGMASRIVMRLEEKRREDVEEQERMKKEAQDRGDGSSLVITTDVISAEEEANYDYLNGEGAWARKVAAEAESQRKYYERLAAAEEARKIQAEWDKAHPVEAAERDAKAAAEWAAYVKSQPKYRPSRASSMPRERSATDRERRQSSTGYYDGSAAGSKVSLDKQVGSKGNGGLLK